MLRILMRVLLLMGLGCLLSLAASATANATEGSIRPLKAAVTSDYGMRTHPITGRYKLHDGEDLRARCGTPIKAALKGAIASAGYEGGYGKTVRIRHADGTKTFYAHQSRIKRVSGRVATGDIIGFVGSTGLSTGCHLHFGAINKAGKPMDPHKWLKSHRESKPQGKPNDRVKKAISIYKVRSGDTLTKIAKQNDLASWRPIFRANRSKIDNPNRIYIGQKLSIPRADKAKDMANDGQKTKSKPGKNMPSNAKASMTPKEVKQSISYWFDRYGASPSKGLQVAKCESGYRDSAVNRRYAAADGSHPTGVFQFVRSTYVGFAKQAGLPARDDRLNAERNIRVAAWGFAHGKASHWSCA